MSRNDCFTGLEQLTFSHQSDKFCQIDSEMIVETLNEIPEIVRESRRLKENGGNTEKYYKRVVRKLFECGLLSATLSQSLGGAGVGLKLYCLIAQELAHKLPWLAGLAADHLALLYFISRTECSDEKFESDLIKIEKEPFIFKFALSNFGYIQYALIPDCGLPWKLFVLGQNNESGIVISDDCKYQIEDSAYCIQEMETKFIQYFYPDSFSSIIRNDLIDDFRYLQICGRLFAMIGIAKIVQESLINYLNMRVQFGTPLINQEIIKTRISNIKKLENCIKIFGKTAYLLASGAEYSACFSFEMLYQAGLYTAIRLTEEAIYLHGATGYTRETEVSASIASLGEIAANICFSKSDTTLAIQNIQSNCHGCINNKFDLSFDGCKESNTGRLLEKFSQCCEMSNEKYFVSNIKNYSDLEETTEDIKQFQYFTEII